MADRKYSSAYNYGREAGYYGYAPDYSQATTEMLRDHIAGYKQGKRDRAKDKENER